MSCAQRCTFKSRRCLKSLVADLCKGDFVRKGSVVARTSHRPDAAGRTFNRSRNELREALTKQPFDPPSRKAIEPDPQARQVVRFLIENGEVTELAPDVLLLRESFERMKSQVAEFISKNGPATVSELRQALGSSRRVMVPLLERLDREGVTRRVGDKRMPVDHVNCETIAAASARCAIPAGSLGGCDCSLVRSSFARSVGTRVANAGGRSHPRVRLTILRLA